MDKNIDCMKKIIEDAKNINTCLKLLNLNYDSCFMCFLYLMEDAIVNYNEKNSYEYLLKLANYIERVYNKLTIKEKNSHRRQILVLRKMYKKQLCSLLKIDKSIFEKVYLQLELLLIDKKEDCIEIDELGDLLYNIIFKIKNLEYLDKLIEKDANILNSYYGVQPIFNVVIDEYLNAISNQDDLLLYYERVINKFLLEEDFKLTNEIKDEIIDKLNKFIINKKLSSLYLKKIKRIIECLKNNTSVLEIPITCPELILKDKTCLEPKEEKISKRVLIDGYIMTIDDIGTKVLDDAISEIKYLPNGNIIYMVHIADPLALISYFSDTMKEAKKRTTTIYLENTSIPMINPYFSEDKLSLIEGKRRYAKTFCIEFDSNYNLVNFKILNSIIMVSKRLSYNSLNQMYTIGGENHEEEKRLLSYDRLISSLKKIFKNASLYEEVKKKNIIGNSKNMESFSESLVSYSMMLVGYLTAKYFEENDLPYVYRCHKLDKKWINLLDNLSNESRNHETRKVIRSIKGELPKSYYSRINDKHMGLDLECYSHITSPLRRYMDNVNMLALNKCYFKRATDKELYDLQIEMDTTCDYVNIQTNTIDECIRKKLIK